jgi:murein DD-endopeptidase MepM/ murein hydrolase activator NlpD
LPLSGQAPVVRPFQPPPTPYSAGHRGVDLATSPGEAVRAAAAGTVTFAGMLADRGVIVIAHADGISTEYEPVVALIRRGQVVEPGDVIAEVAGSHNGCPPGSCLHWGARRDGAYFDPMTLLQPLGPVHLIAW